LITFKQAKSVFACSVITFKQAKSRFACSCATNEL
jgi:hypothetical protein